MTDDMRPPEEIWLDDEALSDHFENVRSRMKSGSSDDWEAIPASQNELTRDLRKG